MDVRLSSEEETKLNHLNAELSREFWIRYHLLECCSRNEMEQIEFLDLVQKAEAWNIVRLELLEEFAQKRKMHFPELMNLLDIRHHPDAQISEY